MVADHRLEMDEKEQLIHNLNNNQKDLKERLKKKNEKSQLTYFYEQQLEEKDLIIAVKIIYILFKNVKISFNIQF